ncbi:chromate transporter [Kurthia massiliensis]|uniref:chromate transporter n=1 Tax=Kurthia massiliensis TaxID=1033739 RepID=UPI000287F706|nr:chromate transporter [Kurthia massiliensis]
MNQKQLFMSFFHAGIAGFGGGNTTILLMKAELVDKYQMLTDDEFYEIMAIGNTVPGPLIAKIAGYLGYRIGGIWGMLNALAATILPSIIMLIILFHLLFKIKYPGLIQGMMNAVLPVITVMMFMTFLDCLKKANRSFGMYKGLLVILAGFVAIAILHIDSSIVICGVIILALLLPVKKVQAK